MLLIRGSELLAGKGGAGGSGLAGQQGQQIFGAGANKAGLGCGGGNGGKGGDGGPGGGGAGGVSVGVLYKGPKPTLDATTTTTGDSEPKGTGGVPTVNDGVDGQKTDALQVQ